MKQASRQWYLKFNNTITSYGFIENTIDRCIYIKVSGSKFIILVLYVDDILLAANDVGLLHDIKKFLSKNFEMKDMGEAFFVICKTREKIQFFLKNGKTVISVENLEIL